MDFELSPADRTRFPSDPTKRAVARGGRTEPRQALPIPIVKFLPPPARAALGIATALATQFAQSAEVSPAEEYRRAALLKTGDPQAGARLFVRESGPNCAQCHTVDGTRGRVGPDLLAAGDKFGRVDLIETVLEPSAVVSVGYSTTTIELRSGEEHSGIVQGATDAWVEIRGVDARTIRHPRSEIVSMATSDVSLMPEGLHAGLSIPEFTDLVEYLASLKQPESVAKATLGAPTEVPMLARPATVEPLMEGAPPFEHPVWMSAFPGTTNTFAVLEHESGRVWRWEKLAEGERRSVFAELGAFQKGTRGNVGFVFHPRFLENGRYFYGKHVQENGRFATHLLEGRADVPRQTDSRAAPRRLLRIETSTGNHYGGSFAFGPDGFLYFGMGDGGPQQDPQGHGQDMTLLLGKILRIDVDHDDGAKGYAIPADNPFVGRDGVRPEIWASGLREPWRFSFDPATHELWVGDVGQDRYEEVDLVHRGENMGWNVYEGFEPFSNRSRSPDAHYAPPVFAYPRRLGVSVTGGFVYRGDPKSSFAGAYIFGDYESRRLFALRHEAGILRKVRQIGAVPQRIVSFAEDAAGEILIVGHEGMIYRLRLDAARFE